MTDPHIPAACLSDARRVLAAQDPDVSAIARQWQHMPAWRAALKIAAAESNITQPAHGEQHG